MKKRYYILVITILLEAWFVIFKVTHIINWSWWWMGLPVYVGIFALIIYIGLMMWGNGNRRR
jgi:hypothetical protein